MIDSKQKIMGLFWKIDALRVHVGKSELTPFASKFHPSFIQVSSKFHSSKFHPSFIQIHGKPKPFSVKIFAWKKVAHKFGLLLE
jgi:hypothetical protein